MEGYFFNDLIAYDLNALQNPNNQWEFLLQNTAEGGPEMGKIPSARTNHSIISYNDQLYLYDLNFSPMRTVADTVADSVVQMVLSGSTTCGRTILTRIPGPSKTASAIFQHLERVTPPLLSMM